MKYLIRFRHPTSGDLIEMWVPERPAPTLKVPVYQPHSMLQEPEDRSRSFVQIAEYECRRPVYTTPAGEPIYDYWRIR